MIQFSMTSAIKYGIPEEAMRRFEQKINKQHIRLHGYMLLKGTDILEEKYMGIYDEHTNHRMYSITKSFTALAIGLLEKEHMISLDDKICEYFPEKFQKDHLHPWCEEMTIRDMLKMRTCFEKTTYKQEVNNDWTATFFQVEPDHIPGTVFSYDTSSSHVLSALVEKLTGKKMLDYMREHFLNEIGFSDSAYIIEDPVGISQGGTGLMCTLRDVARVAVLCNRGGFVSGKEVYPSSFLTDALTNQSSTDLHPTIDEQYGYGYMFWMPREEGFMMYGMGGQLAVCFPEKDFCFLTMADTIGNPAGLQILHDCFFDCIYPFLENLDSNDDIRNTREYIKEEQQKQNHFTMHEIHKRTNNEDFIFYENDMGWEKICFDWEEEVFYLETKHRSYHIRFGEKKDALHGILAGTEHHYESECYWKHGQFFVHIYMAYEEQGHASFNFAWKDERLSVRVKSTNELFFSEFKGTASAKHRSFCRPEEMNQQ